MESFKLLVLFLLLGVTVNCNETKKVITQTSSLQLNGNYEIRTINGIEIRPSDPSAVFISFDPASRTMNGNTGCNAYFGNYQSDNNTLAFSDIGQTEMACDDDIMRIEWDLMEALRETGYYSIENQVLTFFSKSDKKTILSATKKDKN